MLNQNSLHENTLLCQIIHDYRILDDPRVGMHLFSGVDARELFRVMLETRDAKAPFTFLELAQRSENKNYIATISGIFPSSANYEFYLKSLIGCARRRALAELFAMGTRMIDSEESTEAIEAAARGGFSKSESLGLEGVQFLSAQQVMLQTIRFLENAYKNKGKLPGISSGIANLDEAVGGWNPGRLVVVGGRPGTGKSSLVLGFAIEAASKGHPVGYFSLEMPGLELGFRAVQNLANLEGMKMRRGNFREGDFNAILDAAERFSRLPIIFSDACNLNIDSLCAIARTQCRDSGLKMIIIDYLQIMNASNQKAQRYEQIGEISRKLKQLALELDIPILVGAQVKRETEGKPPTMADLRESGSIEQDADVILLLHATGIRDENSVFVNIDVAKNRQGGCAPVPAVFDKAYQRFTEYGPSAVSRIA